MVIKVDWDKAQKLIESLENLSDKPGGTQVYTGDGDFPVTYLNFTEIKESRHVLTCKIIPILEGLPLFQAGYHYALTELLSEGEKMVCPENTTNLEKFECMPCNFFRVKRGEQLSELAWAILKWRKEDPHGFKKLYGEEGCKDLSNKIRPVIKGPVKRFSYLFVAPMPFEDRFMILRLMEDDLPVFSRAFSQSKEKGEGLFDINGYSCRLTWARGGDSKYFNLVKVEFGNKKTALLEDENKIKAVDSFLGELNIHERMGIELLDQDQARDLVKKWVMIMEGHLKLYKIMYDKEKKDYTIPSNGGESLPEESGNEPEVPEKTEEPVPVEGDEFSGDEMGTPGDLPEESGGITEFPGQEKSTSEKEKTAPKEEAKKAREPEPEEKKEEDPGDDMPVIGQDEFDEVLKDLGAKSE